jgi:phage-related protein
LQVFKQIASGVGESIKAFSEGQAASAKLLQSITNNSNLTAGAFGRLTTFADKLKLATGVDDDVINGQIQYLNGLGLTEDKIKAVLTASTNLAAAGVMPLDAAVKAMAKTYEGMGGALAKQIPAIGNLTKEQLAAGGAIALVQKNFAGMAETASNTLEGKTKKMGMVIEDIKKSFGAAFGATAAVAFDAIGPVLEKISSWLKDKLPQIISFMQNLPAIAAVAFKAVGDMIAKVFTWDFMVTSFVAVINAIIQIMKSSLTILVAVVEAVGQTIWQPLKFGFDTIVYGINFAFTSLVNFFIKGFQDLVNEAIGGINKIIDGANKIPGIDIANIEKVSMTMVPDPSKPLFDKAAIDASWKNLGSTFVSESGKIISSLAKAGSTIGDQFAPIVSEAGKQISAIVKAGEPAAEAFRSGADAVQGAVSVLTTEVAAIPSAMADSFSEATLVGAGSGGAYIPTAPTDMESLTGGIGDLFSAADPVAGIMGALGPLVGAVQPLIDMFMSANPLMAVLLPIIQGFVSVLGPAVGAVIKPVIDALTKVGVMLGAVLLPILQVLTPIFNILAQMIITLVTPLIQLLAPALSLVVVLFSALEPILKVIMTAFTILMAPIKFVADLFSWIGEIFKAVGHNIGEFVKNLLTPWKANYTAGPGAFQSDAFSGLGDRIAEIWKTSAQTDLSGYANPSGSGSSTTPGSSASYSGPSVQNFYFTIDNTNSLYLDKRDLALLIRTEIRSAEALGM